MTYAGSSPISCATLPQAASTADIESVRVPSCGCSGVSFMKGGGANAKDRPCQIKQHRHKIPEEGMTL